MAVVTLLVVGKYMWLGSPPNMLRWISRLSGFSLLMKFILGCDWHTALKWSGLLHLLQVLS